MDIKNARALAILLGGSLMIMAPACSTATLSRPASSSPEEVQVGYGTQKEASVVGSVSSLKAEEMERLRAPSMERLLIGRVSGLQIVRRHGAVSVRIRGGTGEPHVVIDGAPSSTRELLALAPEAVDRIDVRKDAGAAVYGFRSANGVILVTTRRAR